MNGCAKWPYLIHNLSHRCKGVLLTYINRQFLPPVAYLVLQKRPMKKKHKFVFGLIILTALGGGGAVLLCTQNVQWARLNTAVFEIAKDELFRRLVNVDDFYVGQEDDWRAYPPSHYSTELSSRIQVIVSDIINFNVNKIWDWLFPWEQSKSDDPWVLLELTKSSNFWIRQMGVASLANKSDWEDYKYRLVAQACDHRTTVALARYPHANNGFFLHPPRLHPPKHDILTDLKIQLTKLPMPASVNTCLTYYWLVALDQEFVYQREPLAMDFITHQYSLPGEDEQRKEKVIGLCLEALASYTTDPGYASLFVANQGLSVMQRLREEIPDPWVQMYVATILSNISQVYNLLKDIVSTGWISVLRQWSISSNAALSLLALTTLANLDRDWISRDLYLDMVLLHPTQRNSQPVYADVVFVHGLRGGAVKTWRQRDDTVKNKKQNECVLSPCWPKDWLAKDCPNIRIISVGYNSILHRWGDHCPYEQEKRTIEGRGRDLIKKLKQAGVGSRPIIWVGHSMGGLLIKEILSLGNEESEFSQFLSQTKGVIFYSVPHRGSSVVDVMMYAKYLLFPSVEVQEMHTHSPKLTALHNEFIKLVETCSIPCLSFGENAKTEFGRPLPKVLVVPLDSSDPGIGKFVSVPDNHINTCKPYNEDDIIYQLTQSFVKDVLRSLNKKT